MVDVPRRFTEQNSSNLTRMPSNYPAQPLVLRGPSPHPTPLPWIPVKEILPMLHKGFLPKIQVFIL